MRVIIFLALAVCMLSATVHAADGEQGASQAEGAISADGAYTLEPVTVTARKQEEDVQKVTASMDAFTDIEIEDSGSRSVSDLTGYMPNVFSNLNYGINRIVIRGLKGPDSLMWAPSAFYVDGVNYLLAEMRNPDLLDLESIEVLKGPQGSLYGGNSETGVVNITTRKPGNELSASLTGGYSSFNTFNVLGKANVPLIEDRLFFNAAVSGRNSDGFMKNEYTGDYASGIEHYNFRGAVRWLATDALSADLTLNYFNYNDEDGSFRIGQGAGKTDPYTIDYDGPNSIDRDGNTQALRLEYQCGAGTITSITTRNGLSYEYYGDGDLTSVAANAMTYFIKRDFEAYSQEFRIASPKGEGPWEWLAGLYSLVQDMDMDKSIAMTAMADFRKTEVSSQNAALFGQATYSFAEKFHLTGGLRLDYTQLQGEQDYEDFFGTAYDFDDHIYNTELLPRLTLAYDLTEDAMVYATASKGFLAGGFNTSFGSSQRQFTYDAEHLWSYEAGAKTSWLDNRLQVNLAGFWQEIDDKQILNQIGTNMWIDNADKARSIGFELDIKARPVRGLDLFAGLGYVDANFSDWDNGIDDYTGNALPFAPDYTYHAGVQYRHASGVFGRLDMTGVSSYYTDSGNKYECEEYQIYNTRLGYEAEDWDIVLWCKNIFDHEYIVDKRDWGGGSVAVVDGAPRSVGLDFTVRF
ncbi:MAG: TonB-dependent receptor [Pseudodesulfovibrio sp.]